MFWIFKNYETFKYMCITSLQIFVTSSYRNPHLNIQEDFKFENF